MGRHVRIRRLALRFPVILLCGALGIHLVLTPLLYYVVLNFVERGYESQFVDKVRATSSLAATQLALQDLSGERSEVESLLEELMLDGQINYAEVLIRDGELLRARGLPDKREFKEDFFFSQHGDNTYYIAVPLLHPQLGQQAILRLGYDESLIQEQIDVANARVLYLAFGFMLLTVVTIIVVIPCFLSCKMA